MLSAEKREFIDFMLESQVLRFGDFVTKSGRNTSYFVNTGNYRTGGQISRLGEFYAGLINGSIGGEFDAMFGPAYKGIPIVTTSAGAMQRLYAVDRPFFFNRKEEKDHGEGGSLVGYVPKDNDRIIVTEDVITAGTAVREFMPVLEACARVKVQHMFISVDRCELGQIPGKTAIMQVEEEYGIKVHSIVNVVDVYNYLKEKNEDADLLARMEQYMEQYCVL